MKYTYSRVIVDARDTVSKGPGVFHAAAKDTSKAGKLEAIKILADVGNGSGLSAVYRAQHPVNLRHRHALSDISVVVKVCMFV
jgi:hypothetical protein